MAAVPNARLFAEGGLYGFVGGAVATVLWLAAETAGVTTSVEVPGRGVLHLDWIAIVTVSVVTGLGAALVALLVDGRRKARRIFTGVALTVLALSLAPIVVQPAGVGLLTRLVLAATHGVVYLAVVPRLARHLRGR